MAKRKSDGTSEKTLTTTGTTQKSSVKTSKSSRSSNQGSKGKKKAGSERAESTMWTNDQLALLVELLRSQKDSGASSDKGGSFKPAQFNFISKAIEAALPSSKYGGAPKTTKSASGVWQRLKGEYKLVHHLITKASGFGWHPEKPNVVTAPNEVWDALIEKKKGYGSLRSKEVDCSEESKPFPLYESLHDLCATSIATGNAAFNPGNRQSGTEDSSGEDSDKEGTDEERPAGDEEDESSSSDSSGEEEGQHLRKKVCVRLPNNTPAGSSHKSRSPSSPTPRPVRKRATNAGALNSIAVALSGLTELVESKQTRPSYSTSAPVPAAPLDPVPSAMQPLERALVVVEGEEGISKDERRLAIDLFIESPAAAVAYVTLRNNVTRRDWLRNKTCELAAMKGLEIETTFEWAELDD